MHDLGAPSASSASIEKILDRINRIGIAQAAGLKALDYLTPSPRSHPCSSVVFILLANDMNRYFTGTRGYAKGAVSGVRRLASSN
jgi:hypothetical protein